MRKRRVILLLLAVALLAAALYATLDNQGEPSYDGRNLSYWLRHADPANPDQQRGQAEEAIRTIGTNAIPYLIQWIRYEQPAWKRKFYQILYEASISPKLADGRESRAGSARWAFIALGAKAEGAIPELIRLMNDPKTPQSASRAVGALASIGTKDVLQPLLTVLTNRQHPVRIQVAFELAELGTNAAPAIPVLAECLKEKMPMSWGAARSLGALRLQPAIAVPALVKSLQGSNPHPRFIVDALGQFGPEAQSAVPILVALLTNQELILREGTTNALLKIAPEVLTNAAPANIPPSP